MFQERFQNAIEVYKHYGGVIGKNEGTKKLAATLKTPHTIQDEIN